MHTKPTTLTLAFLCLLLRLSLPLVALADWGHDSFQNDVFAYSQGIVVSDNSGGAIMVTSDPERNDNLYAYHLNNLGNLDWGSAGVPVYTLQGTLSSYVAISDGQGGAFVAITDRIDSIKHIWLQHLNYSGSLPWGNTGVDAAPGIYLNQMFNPSLATDQIGNLIMACEYEYSASDTDILLQLLDPFGARYLSDNGRFFYNTTNPEFTPKIISDGTDGFYLLSKDYTGPDYNLLLNHLDSSSYSDWPSYPNGLSLSTTFGTSDLAVNSFGEAIVCWTSNLNFATLGDDIMAVKIHLDGCLSWFIQPVCSHTGHQINPQITPDNLGGCWILWTDGRNVTSNDVYMQHYQEDRSPTFQGNGIPVGVSTVDRSLAHSTLTSDGYLAVTWYDVSGPKADIYCNLLRFPSDNIGTSHGEPLCTEAHSQLEMVLLPDNDGGVVSHFTSYSPTGGYWTQYQRIGRRGFLGDASPAIGQVIDHPQDQGGVARVTWNSSYLDSEIDSWVEQYILWSRLPGTMAPAAGPADLVNLAKVSSLPQEDLQAITEDGWTFLESQEPYSLPQYAINAATFGDSTSAGIPYTEYMVMAVTPRGNLQSNTLAGYSVDNLAPGTPLALAADSENSNANLQWTPAHYHDEDLLHYNIYRSDSPDVELIAGNFLASSSDSTYVDTSLPIGTWHYVVTAMDVHGNESPASNEALVQETSAAGADFLPLRVAVQGAWPNPFNPATTIKYAVPGAGQVQLTIFDVRGQAISTLVSEYKQPGYYEVPFDGRDQSGHSLSSGVYFAHLQTAAGVSTGKLVLTK